jgi:hypothetical protein
MTARRFRWRHTELLSKALNGFADDIEHTPAPAAMDGGNDPLVRG